jgi:PKD repeat protein
MWIAAATVPSSLPGDRNTVVPDGKKSWYDAPMPQALVYFKITAHTSDSSGLSELLKGDLAGYGIIGNQYQSPFYAAEIPSSPFMPANDYNWDSWAGQGPYPYWTDLKIKSIGDTEPGVTNKQDMEVYCDNHGIAAMTVDGVNSGTITVQATAEYPAAFKKGKYGPVSSDEMTINWGAIELNPHFQANKTDVAVEELVTFTNLTTAGKHPYVLAEWDFNNDGVFEVTKAGTEAQVMVDVTHAYSEPGVYTVRLQMTDSAPTTRYEVRDIYIIVGGATPVTAWVMPYGLDADPMAINQFLFPGMATTVTLADIEDTMPAQLLAIWNYGGPGVGWKFFVPGWGTDNTLTQLVPGKYYVGIVSTATEWEIPQ